MKLNIVKKKASSLKELGRECIEINDVSSLYDLLVEVSYFEWLRQQDMHKEFLSHDDIYDMSRSGKITFGEKYNDEEDKFEKAKETMIQDYKDGLIRVFLNGNECMQLDEKLDMKEDNEVVFIRLIMLAGRLW